MDPFILLSLPQAASFCHNIRQQYQRYLEDAKRAQLEAEVKGERSEGAKRQPLDRKTGPDAKRAIAAICGTGNWAWAGGWAGGTAENSRKTLR